MLQCKWGNGTGSTVRKCSFGYTVVSACSDVIIADRISGHVISQSQPPPTPPRKRMGDLEGHQEAEAAHTDMSGMLFPGNNVTRDGNKR